ncbi:hypothetical protein SLEP1_g27363 [Rubroshorea leprosula]|uniref:Uncharacterized protein n=1 Tax=Rubroshorea leprosula TaxID=152421 RepID=A0AAV5JYV3_9ROSI|nr:hypothetical protein SLEP1_g27363 [Rubroshorea leprosula]
MLSLVDIIYHLKSNRHPTRVSTSLSKFMLLFSSE